MRNIRAVAVGVLITVLLSVGLAQNAAQHLFSADELKNVVPSEFFFSAKEKRPPSCGMRPDFKPRWQGHIRRSGGCFGILHRHPGKISGYAVTESKLNIGGSELAPGCMALDSRQTSFIVMNVANEDALASPTRRMHR